MRLILYFKVYVWERELRGAFIDLTLVLGFAFLEGRCNLIVFLSLQMPTTFEVSDNMQLITCYGPLSIPPGQENSFGSA